MTFEDDAVQLTPDNAERDADENNNILTDEEKLDSMTNPDIGHE